LNNLVSKSAVKKLRFRSFLKDSDLSVYEQDAVLRVAAIIKRKRFDVTSFLRGKSIGLLFEKPSLRTRVSSETAASLLGATPVTLRVNELHFDRGELPQDAARVLSGYLSLFLARVFSHKLLEELSEPDVMPVVNGLSDLFHPLQALADLLTILESFNGRILGRKLCYVGDGNNVAHSLMVAGVMSGLKVVVSTPKGYEPLDSVIKETLEIAVQTGGEFELVSDPVEAALGSDILYTDVWTSMGSEGQELLRKESFKPYQLNRSLLSLAKPDAIVLHCLPAHFGEEITRDIFDDPVSKVIRQAHNRQPTTAAVFLFCLWPEKFYELASAY
jgi:ornithine carbamoyltransferase